MIRWLSNIFLKILGVSLLISLSDDNGYIYVQRGMEHKLRLSLINILLGEIQIQFFSFPIRQPEERFQLIRIHKLSVLEQFCLPEKKEKELQDSFKNHSLDLSEKDNDIEKEVLLRKLEQSNSIIESSQNKIIAYTSVFLVVVPLFFSMLNYNKIRDFQKIELIIFCVWIYSVINLGAWIFQAFKVREIKLSTFSDLKQSKDKRTECSWQIYYDWQQTRRKAEFFVSMVSYIEECMKVTTIMGVLLMLCVGMNSKVTNAIKDDKHVYTLETENVGKTYDASAVEWAELLYQLQKDNCNKIIILYNQGELGTIENALGTFTRQELVMLTDASMEPGTIKVILED